MKIIISLIIVVIVVISGFAFYNFYFNSYNPAGPTYYNPNESQIGNPAKQLDEGADAGRKMTIQALDTALKTYYS